VLSRNQAALQLRYLQTLSDIGINNAKTIIFPFPTDLLDSLKGLKPNRSDL